MFQSQIIHQHVEAAILDIPSYTDVSILSLDNPSYTEMCQSHPMQNSVNLQPGHPILHRDV